MTITGAVFAVLIGAFIGQQAANKNWSVWKSFLAAGFLGFVAAVVCDKIGLP